MTKMKAADARLEMFSKHHDKSTLDLMWFLP
jgi:hypothetical protein